MRFKHRDQRFNENWNAQKNANRDAAHSRQMERDAAGHDVTMRGQDFDMQKHGDTHGLARKQFNEGQRQFGVTHDFAKQQHSDTHGLARDNLNQQGQQWQSTFDRQGERLGIEDTRYDQEGYDKRQQQGIENERAARQQALEEGKAMRPDIRTGYDPDTNSRYTITVPGLEEQGGRFVPGQAPQAPQQDGVNDLLQQYLEENNRLRNRGLFGRIFNR